MRWSTPGLFRVAHLKFHGIDDDGNRKYKAWAGNGAGTTINYNAVGPSLRLGNLASAQFTDAGVVDNLAISEDMFDEIMTQTLDPNNQLRGAEFVINEYVVDSDDRVVDGPFEELDDADASSEQEQQEAATVNTTSRAGRARQAPNFREMRRQGLI